jgi:hypothetical protein
MEGDLRSATSRWHVFAWLQAFVDAKIARAAPAVDVIELVSRLGGAVAPFNPALFGFVTMFQSVVSIAPDFGAQSIFTREHYFLARTEDGVVPMVGFDFGQDVRMTVGEVTINTVAPLRTARIQHTPKPTATKVVVKLAQLRKDATNPTGTSRSVLVSSSGR